VRVLDAGKTNAQEAASHFDVTLGQVLRFADGSDAFANEHVRDYRWAAPCRFQERSA